MLGAIFISLGSLFQYSWTLLFKQFLLMVLHFALELGQNFDKRFSPDLPNLKTLLVKEKSSLPCILQLDPLLHDVQQVLSAQEFLIFQNMGAILYHLSFK